MDRLSAYQDAVAAIHLTFETLGCPDLVRTTAIGWNARLTSTAGRASSNKFGKDCGLIELSEKLWPHMDEQTRYETAIHEACHIVATKLYGKCGHNFRWSNLMIKMGVQPEKYHSIDCFGLGLSKRRGRRPKHKVSCKCKDGCLIGSTQYKRLLTGTKYMCRKCGSCVTK